MAIWMGPAGVGRATAAGSRRAGGCAAAGARCAWLLLCAAATLHCCARRAQGWAPAAAAGGAPAGFYRQPSLGPNEVVFTSECDLWRVPLLLPFEAQPNTTLFASRLTHGEGCSYSAAVSPDGAHVAFVSERDGALELYVMPVHGGEPRRLTYDGVPLSASNDGGRVRALGWLIGGDEEPDSVRASGA